MKKLKITREWLEKLGFTDCDRNGQLYKGDYPIKYCKVWAKHKYGKDKYYLAFAYYDSEYYYKQLERFKNGEIKYRPSGVKMMLVHRAVYAWFNGETPDNLDVCHKDDNVENNCIDNLKADTHGNNIRERKFAGGLYKWQKNN